MNGLADGSRGWIGSRMGADGRHAQKDKILFIIAIVLSYFIASLKLKIYKVKIPETFRKGKISKVALIA
jgi:hypothetical protein